MRWILDRLDASVLGPADGRQGLTYAVDPLVVGRMHLCLSAQDPSGSALRAQADAVQREGSRDLSMTLVPDQLGKVLVQIAAVDDVEDLHPAADREHRQLTRERPLEQRQLGAVALELHHRGLRVCLCSVEPGIDVGASGEDEAVECVQSLLDSVVGRWHDQRPAPRLLDRANVGERDERRG